VEKFRKLSHFQGKNSGRKTFCAKRKKANGNHVIFAEENDYNFQALELRLRNGLGGLSATH